MRIAFVNIDDSLGGASMACLRLAKAINNEKGVSVDLLVQKKTLDEPIIKEIGSGFLWRLSSFIRFALERLYFYFFEKSKDVRFSFSPAFAGIDITKKVDFEKYDIIHLHWINFGFISNAGLTKIVALNKPIVWSMHDMWPFTGGCHYSNDCLNFEAHCGNCSQYLKHPEAKDLSYKGLIKKELAYNKGTNMHFVGSSKWLGDLARKSSLLKPFHVSNIPTVVSSDYFLLDKTQTRIELGISSDKKIILFVAMKIYDARKGFSYLQEALICLKNADSNSSEIELLIIGDPQSLESENLPFKTHVFGKINNPEKLNKIYNSADVFVIPSLQDNLPNTVMEALATGTPCVGFEIGGIPEMIEHKITGYVSTYKSPKSLADGIRWVLDNEEKEKLSTNCIHKAKNTYGAEVVSKQYLKVYQSLLKGETEEI